MRVSPVQIFVNCPRYVRKFQRVETSRYVPNETGAGPLALWKRLQVMHDTLSQSDQAAVGHEGFILLKNTEAKVQAGEG